MLLFATIVGAVAAPVLRVEQILDPREVFVAGSEASPEVATIQLFIEGVPLSEDVPIDCVLVIDVSATATGALDDAAALALDLLPLFGEGDRLAVVSFSDRAWLEIGLTEDRSGIIRAVADLESGGKSALGEGLRVARQELLDWGRDDARLVEIILSDGQSNVGRTPEVEGEVAAEAGIVLIPIGVGTLINRSLLESLANQTEGLFVPRRADDTVSKVGQALDFSPGATWVRVEKTLPPELDIIEATPEPLSIAPAESGTTLVWEFELAPMWRAEIDVSSSEEGEWDTDVDSRVIVTDARDRRSTFTIPPRRIVVSEPLPPMAFFYVDPTSPQVGVEARLDATGSVVYQDSQLERFEWDLDGDGATDLTTEDAVVYHEFDAEGEMTVGLVVVDDDGRTGSYERDVEVLASVTATRTIETCLPDDATIEGARVNVLIELTINTEMHGLTLHEEYPAGWTVELGDSGHATARRDDANAAIDWLFLETLAPGEYRTIAYTLVAPTGDFPSVEEGQAGARDQVTITGVLASSLPRLSKPLGGEDKIVRLQYLPVPVAISRWDTAAGAVDVCLPDEISFDQIQYAVSMWVSGDIVLNTNQVIDLAMIRDLIAFWLTDSSVFEPLPE